MGKTIFVTGGCRSGKSSYAQQRAEGIGGRLIYVATCPVTDPEIVQRIARHQEERRGNGWETREEQTDLAGILSCTEEAAVLVDCLTLWINNVMYEAESLGRLIDEDDIRRMCDEVIDTCRQREGTTVLVTNEVGMGIVPENAATRRYRDLVGRCNQIVAAAADEVVLVTCGIPHTLKGKSDRVAS